MKITVLNPTKKKRSVMKTKKRRKPVKAKRRVKRRVRRNPVSYARRVKPMAKRRRRKAVVKKVTRRRIRRNPSKMSIDFSSILINGGIAGAGAFTALWLSNKANSMFDKYTGGSQIARNGIALAVAVGGSFLGHKYLDKDKANALSAGMVAGIVLLMMKNTFGVNIGLAGDAYSNPLNNYTLGYNNVGLLESSPMSNGLGILEGKLSEYDEFDEYN